VSSDRKKNLESVVTMPEEMGEITELLQEWRVGSVDAENELFDRVNADLRRLARYLIRGERKGHSLQATELVDHIYIRLVAAKNRDWRNRRHFFAIAATAMRRHLIDIARGRPAAEFVSLQKVEGVLSDEDDKVGFIFTVDTLLDWLSKYKPEWCTLVELKYFLGLTDEEVADAMGIKLRTMQRMWRDSRQWLFEQLESTRRPNRTSNSSSALADSRLCQKAESAA
jgi:RNA polymerase sigma factor (TIGR02999 family)